MADEASTQARGGDIVPSGDPRGDLRAAHDDRDRVVEVLSVAAGDGRITPEELDERVGAALTARTYGELAALISDLPAAPQSPAGAAGATPKDVVRIACHGGTARRDGRWMVPQRMEVRVTSGSVTLDFTEAVTWWPSLHIDAEIRGGSLRLVTKTGILVNTDDLEIRGSSVKVPAPWGPRCAGQVPDRCGRQGQWQQYHGAPATPEVVAMAAAAPLPNALPPSRTRHGRPRHPAR